MLNLVHVPYFIASAASQALLTNRAMVIHVQPSCEMRGREAQDRERSKRERKAEVSEWSERESAKQRKENGARERSRGERMEQEREREAEKRKRSKREREREREKQRKENGAREREREKQTCLETGIAAGLSGKWVHTQGQPQSRVTVQAHYTPLLQNGAGHVPDLGSSNGEAGNGILCSELSSLSVSQKPHRKLQSHHSINSQISKKSKGSSKSASSQIPTEAQEDCCVHCILSCLFCEFLTLCNIMLDCATCGSCSSDDSGICCCCCGSGECADCDLPCDMDCGIIDACCESADCLEICMECCGLCFSS
uniref:Uncharacterized protein n=1 Tax=Sphaerodactylus townsendi TaxID=933632 RepID=A0ACB8F586_9SAUR